MVIGLDGFLSWFSTIIERSPVFGGRSLPLLDLVPSMKNSIG